MKGLLIVVDGIDGSGKHTQVLALKKHFEHKGLKVKTISFPRYDHFFGKLAGDLLKGKLGDFGGISPYLGALPYALDRREAREQMISWLKKGYVVLADRYVSASLAFQAAKLPQGKQAKFISWLNKLEYEIHGLPKEDLVILLDVPITISQKWLKKEKQKDEAEKNIAYQQKVAQVYRRLVKRFTHWHLIKASGTIEEVTERILAKIKLQLDN
jgi:dTMP kinase